MKRGFTLIEIIISITLIIILGTGSAVFVVNTNKNNNLEKITKEILEAGSAYIKIEKDENGRVLANEVVKGAKGVKVPVSNLVSRGYLDESIKNELYSLEGSPNSTNDYYVMFVQEDGDYCNENEIKGISSWMEKGKDVYLCDEYGTGGGDPVVEQTPIFNKLRSDAHGYVLDSIYYGIDICANAPFKTEKECDWYGLYYSDCKLYSDETISDECRKSNYKASEIGCVYYGEWTYCEQFIPRENGLLKRNDGSYYYRGQVSNNYVTFLSDSYGSSAEFLFRIISFNENEIRLIKEDVIDSRYYTIDGDDTTILNSKLFNAISNWYNSTAFLGGLGYYEEESPYIFHIDSDYKNIFKEGKFCTGYTSFNYRDTIFLNYLECNNGTSFDSPFGLMHWDEVIFAGGRHHSSGFDYSWLSPQISPNWLTSGGTFRLMSDVDSVMMMFNSYSSGDYGVFDTVSSHYKESYAYMIRPVIIVDPKEVYYTGEGTFNRPYIFMPKTDNYMK